MPTYDLYFDGACNPNPHGEASYGYVIYLDNTQLTHGQGIIGTSQYSTDVLAELYALSQGLSSFIQIWNKPNAVLNVYGDSSYVIQLVNNRKPLKSPLLQVELNIVKYKLNYVRDLIDLNIKWIPRESNKFCDYLAKSLRNVI